MKKFGKQQSKYNQELLCYHTLYFLIVTLQLVDLRMLSGHEGAPLVATRETLLHYLADLADPFDYSTHENQLILAKQLIEHGANVNATTRPHRETPLHHACTSGVVTD
jgi:ankyrin repeat protein